MTPTANSRISAANARDCGSGEWGAGTRARRAGRHGCAALLPEGFRFHELPQTGTGRHLPFPTGQHHRARTVPYAAAMSSAKSPGIRAGRGHGMLGLDRSAGKRLEQSEMPSDVNAQIEWDRLVQTVVCRG
jgi:hypothetical protein